jgi:cyclopropane-fatty-acyl-phospholipid synthase
MLSRLEHGYLVISDFEGNHCFGTATAPAELQASIEVHNPAFYTAVAFRGSVGAGEAFMKGYWSCDDLTAAVRIFARNRPLLESIDSGLRRASSPIYRAYHWLRRNTREGSKRNIAEHYDLGNQFFSLFLDDTMMYSCAIFDADTVTLRDASVAKLQAICEQLELSSSDHVMEIGSGWGGFAIYAARNYGCRVTTTTVSKQQYDYARKRVSEAGLSDQVTLLMKDYRDLEGCYDKLASIEMIEAVGDEYLDLYFRQCSKLLKPGGRLLIQAITIAEEFFETSRRSVDFVQRYIFPGSSLPSLNSIQESVKDVTDLRLVQLRDLTRHYPPTLRAWRDSLRDRLDETRTLGYSDQFLRAWEFYFSYCEAGFEERHIGDYQLLFARPRD